ncbi:methyltransferase domain-containing protein [Nocardioides mangrovi]|uniref:Methyltransferase domain-containing protein n=1 Tax=Nocardioides mangrovi TaxID=2874580 RepID=A0ABS7UD94_9ACTN|nr:methyltransferase domain-containing protein [Nocardioides mangrovi]MBZ5738969.1 methyltransferase domain-containing protein [Nocardioides mangrovi]
MSTSRLFEDQLAAWRLYLQTPWARIRYATVAEVLRRHVDEVAAARTVGDRVRVLDVGGGDGRDALPLARAGCDVTIVDPAGSWLAEAERRAAEAGVAIRTVQGGLDDLPAGEWDLVLCHFVLRYRPPGSPDVAVLADRVRPGGLLSVVDINPAGRVLRALVSSGPGAALTELHAERAEVQVFGTDARKVEADDVRTEAEARGLRLVGRYGHRIANDLVTDDDAKHDPDFFADLLTLELELCDREPYRRLGAAWQLVLTR